VDVIAAFFRQPTARRGLLLVLFAAVLTMFQGLLPMLAAYAVFLRVFLAGARALAGRTGWSEQRCVGAVLGGMTVLLAGALVGLWFPIAAAWEWFHGHWHSLADVERTILANPTARAVVDAVGGIEALKDRFSDEETLSHMGSGAATAFSSGKTVLVEGVMAFFLALLYALDRVRVDGMVDAMDADDVPRTLLRWIGYVADAFALTVQLQIVVALCNAILTLPILLFMGIPNVGAVMAFTFVAGLVPVVGNYASALVLCALAWSTKGWIGIPVFLGLAVLLGKLESFYLTPRLAAQHVAVPAFILTLSLVIFEVQLGFIGLFLSFPFLYVFFKVRDDLRERVPLVPRPLALAEERAEA
jgi:predicted PurR-regulated permease PerM